MISQDDKEKIIKMWEEGLSGSQIGDKIGVTRSSVIGLINRLRKGGHMFARDENKIRKERVVELRKTRQPIIKNVKFKSTEPIKLPLPEMPTADGGVELSDLNRKSCRFIISPDETNVRYCGKNRERGYYCKEHYKICYYPSRKSIEKELKGIKI